MNLAALREAVKRRSDYSPQNANYNAWLNDIINDAAYRVFTERQWTFTTGRTEARIHAAFGPTEVAADLTEEGYDLVSTPLPVTATTVAGSRVVTFSHPVGKFTMAGTPNPWVGQWLRLGDLEYRIIGIVDSTFKVRLDRPAHDSEVVTDWLAIHRHLALPQDCDHVMGAVQRYWPIRDRVTSTDEPIALLTPGMEYQLPLDGYATNNSVDALVIEPNTQVPAGHTLTATWSLGSGVVPELPVGRYFEFAWAYRGPFGTYGPLSESVVTVAATSDGTFNTPSVLVRQQLDSSQSVANNGTLRQAGVFYLTGNPTSGDTLVLTDGTTTRTFGFGAGGDVTVTIGATVADTMTELESAIATDVAGPWLAILSTGLTGISSNVLVIYRDDQTADSFPDRMYGTLTTPAFGQYVNYAGETDYSSTTSVQLLGADPGAKQFGPGDDSQVGNFQVQDSGAEYAYIVALDTWQAFTGNRAVTLTPQSFDGSTLMDNDSITALIPYFPTPSGQAAYEVVFFWNANLNTTDGTRTGPPAWMPITKYARRTAGDAISDFAVYNQPYDHFPNSLGVQFWGAITASTGSQPERLGDGIERTLRVWPEVSDALRRSQVGKADSSTTDVTPKLPADRVMVLDLMYRRSPKPMLYDTDVPDLPAEFHQVVADRALAEIHLMGNDTVMGTIYERRYADAIKRLDGRYTAYNGADYIRAPMGIGTGDVWAQRRWSTKKRAL